MTPIDPSTSSIVIAAPVGGRVVALETVPDPAFSAGALGPGGAVEPAGNTIVAPIDGEIVAAMPHAYGIRGDGVEVLVHIGIDTVELDGAPFTPLVAQGASVRTGDPLCTADAAAIRAAGYAATVLVIVMAGADAGVRGVPAEREIAAGEPLLTVTAY